MPDLAAATKARRYVLVAKVSAPRPVEVVLDKKPGGGIHQVCCVVDDIHAADHHLKASGARDLGDVEPKIGADEDPVLFLSPKGSFGTLVELEQAGGGQH